MPLVIYCQFKNTIIVSGYRNLHKASEIVIYMVVCMIQMGGGECYSCHEHWHVYAGFVGMGGVSWL